MAYLEVIGPEFGFADAKGWVLDGIDQGYESINFKGQSVAQNPSESVGIKLGENSTTNQDRPNYMYVGGEGETFTFTTKLWAHHSGLSIRQQIELLKSFTRRDPNLKRPPRFLFTMGTEVSFQCFVRGAQFDYDELRPDGSLQGAVINISLQIISDEVVEYAAESLAAQIKFSAGVASAAAGIKQQLGKVINIPGASLHTIDKIVRVNAGETFESIAQREYGNALLGDVLRRVQPDKAPLEANDQVILIVPEEIRQISVTPQSIALKNTLENLALRDEFIQLRNRSTRIFV